MDWLLDTHSLIWFLTDDPKLPGPLSEAIATPDRYVSVSAASLWEIAIKTSLGKLKLHRSFEELFPEQLIVNNIELLPIEPAHLHVVSRLPFHHRDPFDRLIAAQAKVERLTVVGRDTAFDAYEVPRIWGTQDGLDRIGPR